MLRCVGVTIVAVETVSITYSEFVSVALVHQHEIVLRHIVLPLRLYHIFPHYLINRMIFLKKITEHKFVFFLYKFCLKYFSF